MKKTFSLFLSLLCRFGIRIRSCLFYSCFSTMNQIALPCVSVREAEKLQVQASCKLKPKPRAHCSNGFTHTAPKYNMVIPRPQIPHSWPLISWQNICQPLKCSNHIYALTNTKSGNRRGVFETTFGSTPSVCDLEGFGGSDWLIRVHFQSEVENEAIIGIRTAYIFVNWCPVFLPTMIHTVWQRCKSHNMIHFCKS